MGAPLYADYVCANDNGTLTQIFYILLAIMGLGDPMEVCNNNFSFGLGGSNKQKVKQAEIIKTHFFNECVPFFSRILSASKRYSSYDLKQNSMSYLQIKSMQKCVIDLLCACCEHDTFWKELQQMEANDDVMCAVHSLIFIPPPQQRMTNIDLSLCCIRFLKHCMTLSLHDTFWSDRIAKYGLFKNILSLFDFNGIERDNMMNSLVLSIFAQIEDKKMEKLICFLGDEQILQK